MKCYLGPKKVARLSRLIGRDVSAALVRGGWDHRLVEVWFPEESKDGDIPHYYDRNTGVELAPQEGRAE